MAAPLHRHRSSLEGIIISRHQPLRPEDYNKANTLFDTIIAEFEPLQETDKTYKPITLIRLVKEEVGDKDDFLYLFFSFVRHELHGDMGGEEPNFAKILSYLEICSWSTDAKKALGESVTTFARYLMDNFFLPLKAQAAKTPQPTPASLSRPQLSETVVGTPQRISNLRRDCLVRDRHRCVITRKFDVQEAEARYKREGSDVKDDDNVSLLPERRTMTYLEVAHIIPHSLMSLTDIGGEPQLTGTKQIAHKILDMFDPGTIYLISGSDIDRPMNALTLTLDLHRLFGNFEISFEYIEPHTYKIDYVGTDRLSQIESLPVTRTLYLTPDRSIDPPSSRLLKIHRAIGRILYLSGAGEYIDEFFRDLEGGQVSADGSTPIGDYVSLKLRGRFAEMSVY